MNRYINPASDLNCSSETGLQVEAARALPLSSSQLGIWFAQQTDALNRTFSIAEYLELRGPINPLLFEQALEAVVSECETLRVQFTLPAGELAQLLVSSPDWSLPIIDVSAEADARAAAEAWMKADLARSIEPTRGPLFGFALFKTGPDRFFWYARYHHLIMDGYGMWLVARRLAHVYSRLSDDRRGNVAVDDANFGSLSVLLKEDLAYRASDQYGDDRKFWCDYLRDLPQPVHLAPDNHSKARGCIRETAYIPPATVDRLHSVARRAGTTLSRVISAATAIFHHRLSGETDLLLGLAVAARAGAARFIPGMASNVVPLRLRFHPRMTVSGALADTSSQMGEVLRHQRYPIADIRRDSWGIADDGRSPFGLSVNIMRFNYDFTFAGIEVIAHNLSLGPVSELAVAVYERSGEAPLRIDFDANPAVHTAADVADHLQRFVRLLKQL